MIKENKETESFWKWTFKKWYFWIIVSMWTLWNLRKDFPDKLGIGETIGSFIVSVAICGFIFWIIYLIHKGGIKNARRNQRKNL